MRHGPCISLRFIKEIFTITEVSLIKVMVPNVLAYTGKTSPHATTKRSVAVVYLRLIDAEPR